MVVRIMCMIKQLLQKITKKKFAKKISANLYISKVNVFNAAVMSTVAS